MSQNDILNRADTEVTPKNPRIVFELFVRNVSAEFPRAEIWDNGQQARYGWGRGHGDSFKNPWLPAKGATGSKELKTMEILSRLKSRKEAPDIYMFFDPSSMGVFIGNERAFQAIHAAQNNLISKEDLQYLADVLAKYYRY